MKHSFAVPKSAMLIVQAHRRHQGRAEINARIFIAAKSKNFEAAMCVLIGFIITIIIKTIMYIFLDIQKACAGQDQNICKEDSAYKVSRKQTSNAMCSQDVIS